MNVSSEIITLKAKLDELFLCVCSRHDSFQISKASLATLLEASTPTLTRMLGHFDAVQSYKIIDQRQSLFIVAISRQDQRPVPAWLLAKLAALINAHCHAQALLLASKPIVSIWALAPQEFSELISSPSALSSLAAALDYEGLHKFSAALKTGSLWAAVRFTPASELDALPAGLKSQRQAESNLGAFTPASKRVYVTESLLTCLAWLLLPWMFLYLLFARLRAPYLTIAKAAAQLNEAILDDNHWLKSSRGLHYFFQNLPEASYAMRDMVLGCYRSTNPLLIMRSIVSA